jgi:hypothetical protein
MPTFSAGQIIRWCVICHQPLSIFHVGNKCQTCFKANETEYDDGLTDKEAECEDCLAPIGECATGCDCKCHKVKVT